MKIAAIIIRILMGAMFVFSSVSFLFKLMPQPELTGDVKTFMDGMTASVYLMTTVKIVELICGIAFITGFFVPLATVVIFPITLNILLFHVFLGPETILVALLLMLGNLFLAYYYRDKYKPMLSFK
jgi:putative oxidoreductase